MADRSSLLSNRSNECQFGNKFLILWSYDPLHLTRNGMTNSFIAECKMHPGIPPQQFEAWFLSLYESLNLLSALLVLMRLENLKDSAMVGSALGVVFRSFHSKPALILLSYPTTTTCMTYQYPFFVLTAQPPPATPCSRSVANHIRTFAFSPFQNLKAPSVNRL